MEARSASSAYNPAYAEGLMGVQGEPGCISEQENARLAAAVLFGILGNRNPCTVETGSVYGPAIVMPQFARSAGYHKRITELALRSLFFVVVNIVIQGCVLSLFSKEQTVFDKFAGRMALCDFGATLDDCPYAIGCTGPGGTQYNPMKRYPFVQWMNRNFVKDSMTSMFPNHTEIIVDTIDPGEYGVESNVCRIFCCFLYMMAVTKDAFQIHDLWRLLWHVPTRADSWIYYENYAGQMEPEFAENRILTLDHVKLRITGMPLHWKLFNVCFILIPKCIFWIMTADLGIAFLMNTSDITDSIVNSMALAFILSIDELIFDTATAGRTKYMMEHTEPFHVHTQDQELEMPEEQLFHDDMQYRRSLWCPNLLPNRLLLVLFLTWGFLTLYYFTRCEKDTDGAWISTPLRLPKSLHYHFLQAMFPFIFEIDVEDEAIWSMGNQP